MSTLSTAISPQEIYESEVSPVRDAFMKCPALLELFEPDADPMLIELFLIYFNALGVSMTEPVDRWITQAGEKCQELGFTEIGKALCLHATHEAGHHEMMITDTKTLVKNWNERRSFQLDATEVLAQPLPAGVQKYVKLHEDVIASDTPFGQIAIELEIERLSVDVGPVLIKQCLEMLGPDVVKGLSFLEEHIALDVSHTHFNQKQMDKFLAQYPDAVMSLADTAKKALGAYQSFLDDCVQLAKAKMATIN